MQVFKAWRKWKRFMDVQKLSEITNGNDAGQRQVNGERLNVINSIFLKNRVRFTFERWSDLVADEKLI